MYSLPKSVIVIGILTVAATGCNSSDSSATIFTPSSASVQQKQHRQSWMLGEASGEDLLYIEDAELGSIEVYSYTPPKYKLIGLLANPNGYSFLCVNKAQDIFVTEPHAVIEYKHGVTSPLRILGNLGGPLGCAVDPATGTLAVPNATPTAEVVSLFKKNRGRHTNVPLPKPYLVRDYCAYDNNGNLFITSVDASYPHFALLELPKNSKTFVEISLDETFTDGVSGGMVWDGKYLDMADYQKNVIYQFAIAGQKGTTSATIDLQRSYNIGGFFIEGRTLIVPAASKPHQPSQDVPGIVNLYDYPAGGKKTGVIRGVSYPLSVVVSLANS